MKKKIIALFAFVSVLALMPSCTKIKEMLEPKYNIDAMIEDYPKYQEQGETEKVQKLLNKLVELNKGGLMTDDQFFALEPYLTEEESALFDEEEPYVSETFDYTEDEDFDDEYAAGEEVQY